MTTATGAREVPFPRQHVWRALTGLVPYCPVCDVSYVFADMGSRGSAAMREGTRFVCVPGRLEGLAPPPNAARGEVVVWDPEQRISTRIELASETWVSGVELADSGPDCTLVTVTITREPKGGHRLVQSLQRQSMQRLVQRTVDGELAKLPAHLSPSGPTGEGMSMSASTTVEDDSDARVLYLRGEVDASAINRLQLERRLREGAIEVVDVAELVFVDSTGLRPLVGWARDAARAGRPALVRGENQRFDDLLSDMGLTARFARER